MAKSRKQENAVLKIAGQNCIVSEVQRKLQDGDIATAWYLAETASSLIQRATKISRILEVEVRGLLASRKLTEAEKVVADAERN